MNVSEPGRRIILVRGIKSVMVLVKRERFHGGRGRDSWVAFAEERAFDLAYAPDMARADSQPIQYSG